MKILLIIWFGLFSSVAASAATGCLGLGDLRDPFTSPEQERIACPTLTNHHHSPISVEKIKQWQLQGVLGNCYRGYWALMTSTTGEWRTLRLNDRLEGYLLVAIDSQSITLKWSEPSSPLVDLYPPLIISLAEKTKIPQPKVTTKS